MWYNQSMENENKRHGIVKKLNQIYKMGYVASRGGEKYTSTTTLVANCFGHACFNLDNKSLDAINSSKNDLKNFFRDFSGIDGRGFFEKVKYKIRQVGLKIEESSLSEKMDKNQWKIAYFIQDDIFRGRDLHFMIQESDGTWTSKLGTSSEVEVYNKLPKVYKDGYELAGIYKITNPYVNTKQEEMEL